MICPDCNGIPQREVSEYDEETDMTTISHTFCGFCQGKGEITEPEEEDVFDLGGDDDDDD